MFYCTIYRSYNRVNAKNKVFDLALCLAYASEADATRMKDQFLQQAKEAGATDVIEAFGAYHTVYGSICLGVGGIERSSLRGRIYSIGVETQATRFSRLPEELKNSLNLNHVIKDGYKYEQLLQSYLQRNQGQQQAKQDKLKQKLASFETELSNVTELDKILAIFFNYASQNIDKEKLIALTVKKIKGEPKPEKTLDWFDELSDINTHEEQ